MGIGIICAAAIITISGDPGKGGARMNSQTYGRRMRPFIRRAISAAACCLLAALLLGGGAAALAEEETGESLAEHWLLREPDSFMLFGPRVRKDQERLEFEGLPQIRRALERMPQCRYLLLDDCGTSNEAMAALREEYEGRVKVVWRVHFGFYSDLTDTKIIHAVAPEQFTHINDKMCEVLKYCTEVEYIDVGHDPLTTIEFCCYMPKLKMAIFSFNNITDLSPLENCPDLVMLELFACRYLSDLTPLTKCQNLELLNFAFTAVTDIRPLYALKKLWLLDGARNEIPPEQIAVMQRLLPECRMTFEGDDIHEVGWRKIEEGRYYDWYLEIRDIFGYDRYEYSGKQY